MKIAASISTFTCVFLVTFSAGAQVPRYERREPVADQPVVADNVTGLMWQGCAAGLTGEDCASGDTLAMNWQDALSYCQDLDWGGHTDWRLPNVTELTSIVDDSRRDPAIDLAFFPETPSVWFWSSSSYTGFSSGAWRVDFSLGYVGPDDMPFFDYARCVRGGP